MNREAQRVIPIPYELAVSQVKDCAIFMMDPAGKHLSWNQGVKLVLGWDQSEWLGTSIHDTFPQEDRAQADHELEKARADGRVEGDRWQVKKDGTSFFASGITTALRDESGNLTGYLKVMRDMTERRRSVLRLEVQSEVNQILAEALTVEEAATRVMETVCARLRWDAGNLWMVDEEQGLLRLVEQGPRGECHSSDFQSKSRATTFHRGVGLPGRVWESGEAAWIADLRPDQNFPRLPVALKEGLAGAFAFPIVWGGCVLAVMEFLTRERRQPDPELLRMMEFVGRELGQFVQRVRAGERLQRSEARHKAAVETALDCILGMDKDGNIVEFNPAAERVFGFTRAQVLGREMASCIIPPEFRERHRQGLQRYLSTGEARVIGRRFEIEGIRKNGERFPCELSITRNPGEPLSFTGFIRDIGEQKRAADELAKGEQRFRALLTASSYVMYRMSPDWKLMYHLEGADFMASTVEPSSAWLDKYIFPDDQEHVMRVIREAIDNKRMFELEHRVRRVDGSVGWTLSRAVPLLDEDGEITEWFGAASDVTDRKHFELGLAADTRVLEAIATGTPLARVLDLLARTSEEGSDDRALFSILLLDEAGERLVHGAGPSLPPEYKQAINGLPVGPNEGTCGVAAYEKRGVCTPEIATAPSWARFRELARRCELAACCSNPVFSSQGRVLGTVAMYYRRPREPSRHDQLLLERAAHLAAIAIEQRQSEEMLRKVLESEKQARASAEQASRLKDEFLATLSHELRTPLNAILGWSQILRRRTQSDPETAEGLLIIERNSRVQVQLIEDLLDMSRIISGKLRLDVQRVSLHEVIAAALDSVRPAAHARQIQLESVLDSQVGPIRGDPARLQQVFWNLLNNAIKFTPPQGKVQVALRQADSHVEVTVADTGAGIARQFLPYVFDRFRQADGSTTRRHGGLGLGLAIVKSIVEMHGGQVRATSAGEGQGATFSVELPLLAAGQANEGAGTENPKPAWNGDGEATWDAKLLEGLRVLVIDDERDARELIGRILESCKARIVLASSAAEAYSLLERERPDILVSDIGMPGEDGYSLIQQVRKRPAERGGSTPAVALTAFARSEDRRKALLSGYQAHLAKPVEPSELVRVVASLAGRIGKPTEESSP